MLCLDRTVGEFPTPAVACAVYGVEPRGGEVVYLNWKKKVTNSDIVWRDGQWQFAGGFGGYADNNPRLAEFVAILRRGPLAALEALCNLGAPAPGPGPRPPGSGGSP